MDLEKRERRSSLKHGDSVGIKRLGGDVDRVKPKRRISFCGRKSVREFHAEEKPKSWNNSYEISDHLNISGNSSLGGKSTMIIGSSSTDHKENVTNVESNISVSKNCHQIRNRSKVLRQTNPEISNGAKKDFINYGKNLNCGNKNEINDFEINPITTEDIYYGNEDILTDDKFVSMVNHNRSVMQVMEMDISKVRENEAYQTYKLVNVNNDVEIKDITKLFNDQHTFDSLQSIKNAGRRLSITTEGPMDISMHLNECMQKNWENNQSYLNSKGDLQITVTTETNVSKMDVLRKVCSSSENIFSGTLTEIKNCRLPFENLIVESDPDDKPTNNNSFLSTEAKLDIKNCENTSLRSVSYDSPLFPPIKSKKLNLRQLNAEICDGKIIVFPNKIKQCFLTNPNINSSCKTILKDGINDISYDINTKNYSSKFSDYEDMTSDSTSFLVKEKVGDETGLGNVSKLSKNGQCSSEIDTSAVLTASFIKDKNVESINTDFHNFQNTNELKSANYILNSEESNESSKELMRSIHDILDMSLNLTNIQTVTNVTPKSIKSVASATYDETKHVFKLDVTPQNNNNLCKRRHTIYFNQDIAPLKAHIHSESGFESYKIEPKQSQDIHLIEDNYNNEFKYTPVSNVSKCNKTVMMRKKSLDFSDGSSDSLILNLKEARAALSSNCKRRIEGTPHRSFLEFVHLEKEVEKDDEISFDKSVLDDLKLKSLEGQTLQNLGETEEQKRRTDNRHRSLISSPISDLIFYKRPTANLTPNLPFPKKRQTLLFNDCPMDQSINSFKTEPKNISCDSINEYSLKKYAVTELKDKKVKTDKSTNCNTSLKDISLKEDTLRQAQMKIEASEGLKVQNETSPRIYTFQSRFPITSNCSIKERKSNSVNSAVTSKGVDSTMIDVSLDTIQLPRKAATKLDSQNSILKVPFPSITSDRLVIENESFKNVKSVFENNPITISDVSVYYLAQQKSYVINGLEEDIRNEYLTDSNKTAVFNKQFINLERENSSLCISEIDDIEKTRLSLVETFASENVEDCEKNERSDNQPIEELIVEHNCVTNRHIPMEKSSLLLKEKDAQINTVRNKNRVIICRRCKHNQESFSSGSMSITSESFALPPSPPSPSLGLEHLMRFRNLPKLKNVHEYWRRRSLEKNGSNLSLSLGLTFDSDCKKTSVSFNEILHKDNYVFKKIEKQINELQLEALRTDIAFKNLNRVISETFPNWVFNYQTRARNIITLVHKKIVSFSIEIIYSDDVQLGNYISIQDVCLRSGRVSSKFWKPIDHILDFNLKINLPVDLKLLSHAYNNEDPILKLLQHMDEVCTNILGDARSLWILVCREEASLIRYSNRVIVRKFTRAFEGIRDNNPLLKKIEFQIEINNIRTLSVKDIISPPLYAFSDELQFLPSGIDFLKEFLMSPCRYLKQ
ncbi:uncharacterized protein LOC126763882 isoform X2 [Bactrocera neohumeralis]|uniref:uncharacterized protein LOC126763882 isoform X2 n=1 Tax=Bactrocera neohumeralis TaxID=98809 RepID=UPI00216691ED|nr:uncharacterized protein LOC126763882 isoform X2 [Bactrocera neohumeralis]